MIRLLHNGKSAQNVIALGIHALICVQPIVVTNFYACDALIRIDLQQLEAGFFRCMCHINLQHKPNAVGLGNNNSVLILRNTRDATGLKLVYSRILPCSVDCLPRNEHGRRDIRLVGSAKRLGLIDFIVLIVQHRYPIAQVRVGGIRKIGVPITVRHPLGLKLGEGVTFQCTKAPRLRLHLQVDVHGRIRDMGEPIQCNAAGRFQLE
ncbi:hypothetical protein D3C73_1087860 [compost metagenome]